MMLLKNFLLLLLFFSTSFFAENNFVKVRNQIAKINIGFSKGELPSKLKINELESIVGSLIKENTNYKEILKELKLFRNTLEKVENVDSVKKEFLRVNNLFNSTFGKFIYQKVLKLDRKKIVVLSTSVSCECTLEMCYNQEAEVQKFCNDYGTEFEYAVIDTWTDSEIQDEYKVGFIPTVIVLDENNEIINKFSRMENINQLLERLIRKEDKK